MDYDIKAFTQNRELSWLTFNDRVLEEAADISVPILERLKFISIFASNLDEFFMIRVGSFYEIVQSGGKATDNKTGMTAQEQIDAIYKAVRPLYKKRDQIYQKLKEEMDVYGIYSLQPEDLTKAEKKYVREYFSDQILPLLSPQIVDTIHPFPHLINGKLYVVANLKRKNQSAMGIVPVPKGVPDVLFMPGGDLRFMRLENIILSQLDQIFEFHEVQDGNYIRATRNGDLTLDDEVFDQEEDFRAHMQHILHSRAHKAIVRIEVMKPLESHLEDVILKRCHIKKWQIFVSTAPMKMEYAFALESHLSAGMKRPLLYNPFEPQNTVPDDRAMMIRRIKDGDLLLSYPYESMEPFLQLIREAAQDPRVMSIKITIYRLARSARLVEYLSAAAENGKEVLVLMELRARFDEQNNIDWSERLETAGCRVIYGFEDYKVHSKVCLITLRGEKGVERITQIGTGNYNEKTAKQYTDFSLMTANKGLGEDAAEFFKNLSLGNIEGNYDHLLVSPLELKPRIISFIEEEAAKGANGYIFIKCNSVTDKDIIAALSRASCAGTPVQMIVRGICCLLPGIPGYTENIKVRSIVGRFLEHPRIFIFGNEPDRKLFIGSADIMTRNTERRIEVLTPVYDPIIRRRIESYVSVQLSDNLKARELGSDGRYHKVRADGKLLDAQAYFMEDAKRMAIESLSRLANKKAQQNKKKKSFFSRLMHLFHAK